MQVKFSLYVLTNNSHKSQVDEEQERVEKKLGQREQKAFINEREGGSVFSLLCA